jgi:predicted DNA-binding transcriptional regulator YafY
MIKYIKLGNSKSDIYEIEPLLITSNKDGSVLEAIDLNDNKVKTFIINRIININDKLNILPNSKKEYTEIEVAFNLIDENLLKKLNNYKHKKNKNSYLATFRNKNIAIEFFIENFDTAKVISPDIVKVEVMKRINSIKKLLTK